MAFKMSRVHVYHKTVKDEPGGIAAILKPLGDAGAHLEYVYSQRSATQPGMGDLYIAPLQGSQAKEAAKQVGMCEVQEPIVMRVEGDDRAGLGGKLTMAWESAGLNLHGMVMTAVAGKFIGYVTFDTADDANQAAVILSELANRPI